jgi:hypothetical protein
MKNQVIALIGAVLVCVMSVGAHAQQAFSSESGSWTCTMPAGWQFMSKEMVAKINKEYKVRNPEHPAKVVAGFIKAGALFAYPQVVLEVCEADMSKLSWPAVERMVRDGDDESDGAETAYLISEMVDSVGVEDEKAYQFNEAARTVGAKGMLVLEDQAAVETACRAFLHSGGVVQLTALERTANAGGAQKVLDQFANSFKVNAGHEFTPVADKPRKPQRQVSYSPGMRRYGMFGGGFIGIGGIVLLVRLVLRAWVNGD